MWLCNLHSVGSQVTNDIYVEGDHIAKIGTMTGTSKDAIVFNNALVFQGLINAHDHLEFNLFPQLKSHFYEDYKQWSTDIHAKYKSQIDKVLTIPIGLRIQWGIVKNFLNGVTTVVDHGSNVFSYNPWVDVLTSYNYLHSVGLERHWKLKLNHPLNHLPVMTHIGEGVNDEAKKEIDRLVKWNVLGKKLIGIHGIAMDERQAVHFEALIWCPDSNYFLYNATAPVGKLSNKTSILFGTDSTLSASANFWEQLRLARNTEFLDDQQLFDSFTSNPTALFGLEEGLKEKNLADIVIAKKKGLGWDAFYAINPEDILMIIKNGEILYFDAEMKDQIDPSKLEMFDPIYMNGIEKFILKDVVALVKKISAYDVELPLPITLSK